MFEHEVRPLAESEYRASLDLFLTSLHRPRLNDNEWADAKDRFEPERILGAFVGDDLIGTTRSLESALAVPGGAFLPAAAVTGVGVRADRTRRGALTALMNAQLSARREHGDALAMLHASEAGIYGRYGYGVGTRARRVRLRTRDARLNGEVPSGSGHVRMISSEEAKRLLPELSHRIGLRRPGMMTRSDVWWKGALASHPSAQIVVHEDHAGFAMYETTRSATDCVLEVVDLHAATVPAVVDLWRYLLNVDLVTDVVAADRPLDEPLEWWLTDRRVCRVEGVYDDLWIRLLDVPLALAARGYGIAEPVCVAVRDPLFPANSGTYLISPDGASRCDKPAQLSLDVGALGAAYLGDSTVSTLVAANRVEVHDPCAVATADRLLGTIEVPWCGTGF